jgi:hypothetical protein
MSISTPESLSHSREVRSLMQATFPGRAKLANAGPQGPFLRMHRASLRASCASLRRNRGFLRAKRPHARRRFRFSGPAGARSTDEQSQRPLHRRDRRGRRGRPKRGRRTP